MKTNVSVRTPVIRNLRSLFKEPLPREPVIVHLTADEWGKLGDGLSTSRRRVGRDAKGIFVVPDPFGGYLSFFACAAGSGEGLACLPELVRTRGAIVFGRGCTCIRGTDPVDPPDPVEDSCSLAFTTAGKLTCIGTCARSRKCQLVRKQVAGRTFITCECS